MNYCTITINDQKVGLKFGMASFRYLSDGKLVEGKSFVNNELNEVGIAHILYSGYFNNCLVKDVEPSLTFEDFVEHIEKILISKGDLQEITNAIKVWSTNELIKQTQVSDEPKKKTSRGKTSKPLG
jgi:hypothetical protein